jgi:hypothetical protein
MTKEEFIQKIQTHRKEAERLIEGDGGYKIKRGMAHVISGYVEDLFALYIAKNIGNKNLDFYVDKVTSIRFNPNEKAKSFKPDLSIINENILTHYFDLKTNMGWNRHFEEYLEKKNDFIEKLKGRDAWIHWENGNQSIAISPELRYQMVVVFGWNINQNLLKKNLKKAKEYPNIEVHVLYEKKEGNTGYEINEKAFDNVINSVKA